MKRLGPGPVFEADCLATSRRWQVYAGRTLLVSGVLIGLTLVWFERFADAQFDSFSQLAAVGHAFFGAIMGVELVLALLVVPTATAGSICQDKTRGALTLMMATDLSDAEIVLGRFASRLVAVLGVVACGFPVLAITATLGGLDPMEALGGTMTIVGVAMLGVAVSMTFSVWASKANEALMATYALWAVWLLAAIVWEEMIRGPANWLHFINPFWVIFANRWGTMPSVLESGAWFLLGSTAITVLLALLSTWRIRSVTLHRSGRPARRREARLRRIVWPWATLDRDPILWREGHRRRSSGWARGIWWLYALISTGFTLVAILDNGNIAPGVAAFSVSIGLLIVSVGSATALGEERALGSLDVVMATPLSTRSIVLGKWRGAFRIVPRLAILPGVIAAVVGLQTGRGFLEAIPLGFLVSALVVGYGAVVTSVGLALAAWQPRLGRAVGLAVAFYLFATVFYPTIILIVMRSGPNEHELLWPSPFFGVFLPLGWITWRGPFMPSEGWIIPMALATLGCFAVAAGLLGLTLRNFDRLLGRVPDRPRRGYLGFKAPRLSKPVRADWSAEA